MFRNREHQSEVVLSTEDHVDFATDLVHLLTKERQGHMERWEYSPSLFPHDPAGGSDHWAKLVEEPGNYYLTEGDINNIHHAVAQPELHKLLENIHAVIELGPGSTKAIENKTIPFLKACRNVKKYIAIDEALEQAKASSTHIKNSLSVNVGVRQQNFMREKIYSIKSSKTAFVMWGSSLGNIEGGIGQDPYPSLINTLNILQSGMKVGDIMLLCFDTEHDEKKVIRAYSEVSLQDQILSIIYRAKRDSYASGNFDPRVWRHKPVWDKKHRQCAHIIYPLFDQNIFIGDHRIKIPAWTEIVSNNSYKFCSDLVIKAAEHCNLRARVFKDGPMALLVAEKL
ncbi:MAG: L-histidine N(alpha)-methyltransferase [Alphaproteobacteria bacterium]|jgi:uncharacterized SAM-dependent methyltransferase|nr:L-histidine N(alpha)-methyltransferase [Alphaproteobacteria bacterium]